MIVLVFTDTTSLHCACVVVPRSARKRTTPSPRRSSTRGRRSNSPSSSIKRSTKTARSTVCYVSAEETRYWGSCDWSTGSGRRYIGSSTGDCQHEPGPERQGSDCKNSERSLENLTRHVRGQRFHPEDRSNAKTDRNSNGRTQTETAGSRLSLSFLAYIQDWSGTVQPIRF